MRADLETISFRSPPGAASGGRDALPALSGSLVVRREMLFAELKAGPAHVAWAAAGAAFRATEGCLARGPQTTGYDAAFVAVIIGA